jgi:endoplasmic reticulum-Golgi intermediate compartment protein 2
VNTASSHFYKFQYFMSVVPTTYQVGASSSSNAIHTNQYAVTEQSTEINERTIPGIFFKYDIEPILLNIVEDRDSFFVFLVKIVNVISGALVAGHWCFTLSDWVKEVVGKRRRVRSEGMLGTKGGHYE